MWRFQRYLTTPLSFLLIFCNLSLFFRLFSPSTSNGYVESSASNFISEMKLALKNASFHDVTFLIGDQVVNANRAVLAARCKFFRYCPYHLASSSTFTSTFTFNPFLTFLQSDVHKWVPREQPISSQNR